MHATLLYATQRLRPSRHRYSPVQASPGLCPFEPSRPPGVKQALSMARTSTIGVRTSKKWGLTTGKQTNNTGEDSFLRSPLAEFGADAVRPFANHTTGVRGTGVRPRRCRWYSGRRRPSAGCTETGAVGRSHLDIYPHHHYYRTDVNRKDADNPSIKKETKKRALDWAFRW